MPVKKQTTTQKTVLTPMERAVKCAELAFDKKAYDIRVLDITRVSSIADFLVIITGNSDRQVQAIAENIRSGLKKYGKIRDMEGEKEGKWVVMDYDDVLVHIFHDPLRSYYDLDGLWSNAEQVALKPEIMQARRESDF